MCVFVFHFGIGNKLRLWQAAHAAHTPESDAQQHDKSCWDKCRQSRDSPALFVPPTFSWVYFYAIQTSPQDLLCCLCRFCMCQDCLLCIVCTARRRHCAPSVYHPLVLAVTASAACSPWVVALIDHFILLRVRTCILLRMCWDLCVLHLPSMASVV